MVALSMELEIETFITRDIVQSCKMGPHFINLRLIFLKVFFFFSYFELLSFCFSELFLILYFLILFYKKKQLKI